MIVLNCIGNTPLVRLQHICRTRHCEILVKLESRNPGGSIKDRPALAMIEAALSEGRLSPEGTIVEPTSGNMGIGLAMAAASKKLKIILTMPESMSDERKMILRGYGAELRLTPAKAGMAGAVDEALKIATQPDCVLLDQFSNPANALAHYRSTGPEILRDAGQVDAFVAGVGTGGTISGVGHFLREKLPNIHLYAVEPQESPLLSTGKAGPHAIQGIGANFIPKLLDKSLLTDILTVPGEEAKDMARRLMQEEGICCGISSGANVVAATKLASTGKFSKIVTVLPDTGERYLTTNLFR